MKNIAFNTCKDSLFSFNNAKSITYDISNLAAEALREKVTGNLLEQGFIFNTQGLISREMIRTKDQVRSLHAHCHREKILLENRFVANNYSHLSTYFADGDMVEPLRIEPIIVPVKSGTVMSDLFRFATLLWSVPVSRGFGRRIRFLVFDAFNGKLIGLFALGDPIFNLNVRDKWIGWNSQMRKDRLYNTMDMFVLGAFPPYSNLLCGKLMVLLAASNQVRHIIWNRYLGSTTTITQKQKSPALVLLTTSSALGRSSLFNRISYQDRKLIFKIGNTAGWGHFHLSNGTFLLMRSFLENIGHPINKLNRFGQGPNWKIRVIRTCLEILGMPKELLRHGLQREVYLCPLARNYKEYLVGQCSDIEYYDYETDDLISFFKERWLVPRAQRSDEFKSVKAAEVFREIRQLCDI